MIRVDELKAEVAFLKDKVQKFTDFIEAKGLVEAFKEFLNPKKAIEKVRENSVRIAPQRASVPIPAKKKKSGSAR